VFKKVRNMETLEASPVSNDEIPTDYNSDEALELDATKMTDAQRRVLAVRLQKTLAKERAKTARLLKVREEEFAELEKKAAAALDTEKSMAMNSLLSFLSNPLQVYDVSGSTACAEPIVSNATYSDEAV
jgi:selenocysteine-specific translation elongation factor